MKQFINNVGLFVSFFALCLWLSPSVNAINGKNPLIDKACGKAKAKELCVASLAAEHASKTANNLGTLALISVKVAMNNGSNTSVYIRKTLDMKKLEPAVEQNFDDCEENYISATQQLDGAAKSIVSKNNKDAKTFLESAINDAITCEAGLKKMQGNQLELPKRNNMFRQLCSNSLDIVNVLMASV